MRGTRNTAPGCTGLMFLIPFFQQRVAFPCVPGRNSSDREQGPLLRRWAVWFLEDLLPTILVAQKSLPSHLFASPCPAGQGECHCRVWRCPSTRITTGPALMQARSLRVPVERSVKRILTAP